jgi:hypothetical protein
MSAGIPSHWMCYVAELSTPVSFVVHDRSKCPTAVMHVYRSSLSQTLTAKNPRHNLRPDQEHTDWIISAINIMGAKPSFLTQASIIKWRCHKCSLLNMLIHRRLTKAQAANVGRRRKSATNVPAADTDVASGNAQPENCRPTSCGWRKAHGRNCEKGTKWWKCSEKNIRRQCRGLLVVFDDVSRANVFTECCFDIGVHLFGSVGQASYSTDVPKATNERRLLDVQPRAPSSGHPHSYHGSSADPKTQAVRECTPEKMGGYARGRTARRYRQPFRCPFGHHKHRESHVCLSGFLKVESTK